jgi:hypothetical protein
MVPRVWQLCGQSGPTDEEWGPNSPVKRWGAVRRDSNWCSRTLSTELPRKPIPPNRYGLFYEMAGSLRYSQSRGFNHSRSPGYELLLRVRLITSYTVIRAVTSNLICYRKFYSASEWANRPPGPCTSSRTVWWSATSRWWKNTCGRSSRYIKGTGTRDYSSFSLAYRASHYSTCLTPVGLVFGRDLRLPCDPLFGAPQTRNDPQQIMRQT